MADYPSSVWSQRTIENRPNAVYDPSKTTRIYAEDLTLLAAEVIAIETILGLNPQGSYDTVVERLDDIVSGGGIWGSITGTLSDQTDLQSALDAKQNALGFTAENSANKSTNVVTDQASNTKYPSVKAVYDWVVANFQTALGFTPENVANKSTSVSTDQASNTKYPSVKSVYDWATATFQAALGFTAENVANKDTDGTLAANSDTKYASQKATKTYADTKQAALGFTPENVANKSTTTSLGTSNTLYPTQNAVKVYADTKATKAGTPTNGDIGTVDASGNLVDSGKVFSTDTTLAGNSDANIPTQKAVKTYADTKATKAATPTNGDIGAVDASGNLTDSGKSFDTDGALAANSDAKIATQKAVKTYVDAAKISGVEIIDSGSFPAANVKAWTSISAKYRKLILIVNGWSSATAARAPWVQISINNGTSYINSGYIGITDDGLNTDGTTLSGLIATIAAARSYFGSVTIEGYQNSAAIVAKSAWKVDDASSAEAWSVFYSSGSSPVNAIRLICSGSGNMDGGTYVLAGIL